MVAEFNFMFAGQTMKSLWLCASKETVVECRRPARFRFRLDESE